MSRTAAVIYLWAPDDATADASFDELSARCEQYAFRFCWEVVDTVRDVGDSNEYFDPRARVNAFGRTGLDRVLAFLKEKRAVIVLVPDAQMIGSTPLVYNAVREHVEKHGCFLQVVSVALQDTEPRSAQPLPGVTVDSTNAVPGSVPANEAESPMTKTSKARILGLAKRVDLSDGFGALLHMTALMVSDAKTLVPYTEEERFAWGGHLDGLHAALLCLVRHEQQCDPEVAAEIVDSLLSRAQIILQQSPPGSEGSRS
jgi:hypothetical protein